MTSATAHSAPPAAWIGTSGWSYPHWRGVLYEPGLDSGLWLERYAREFPTVELNGSFYRWPGRAAFARWAARVPQDFAFTVKAPRGLTHARKLRDPATWYARIAEAWEALDGRAAVLLLQLPPDLERDDERLDEALRLLPPGVRTTVEFRHPSWVGSDERGTDEVLGLLEKYGVAYCVTSGAHLPCLLRRTAPFVYVRLHGPDHEHLYAGSYSDADLAWWADRIREWRDGGADVFAYFNNDGQGHAVRNARRLLELTGT